jgi:hypothetical protein
MEATLNPTTVLPRNVDGPGDPELAPPRGRPGDAVVSPQGQLVVVIARWVLVIAGFALSLWNAHDLVVMRVQVGTLLVLAVANFYLHAQLLRRRPVLDQVAYWASGADLAAITAILMAQGGYRSDLYVFYCVALLAMAVAFPLSQTVMFAGGTVATYAAVAVATLPAHASDVDALTVVCRLLMLVGVAACGQLYQWVERRQERERLTLADHLGPAGWAGGALALEAKQDVFFGQVVLIWARWLVILAGAVTALWLSEDPTSLTLNILPVVVLMGVNFYLHARYLLERPANRALIQLLSAVDLAMVTAIVAGWDGMRGLASPFFVYYYPLLLAFGFVFPPRLTAAFTGAVLATYAAVCLLIDPTMAADASSLKMLVVRLITLGAMGGLGTFYWRIQRTASAAGVAAAV